MGIEHGDSGIPLMLLEVPSDWRYQQVWLSPEKWSPLLIYNDIYIYTVYINIIIPSYNHHRTTIIGIITTIIMMVKTTNQLLKPAIYITI